MLLITKGYPVSYGYMGYVNGKYMLFETEDAYIEYLRDKNFEGYN